MPTSCGFSQSGGVAAGAGAGTEVQAVATKAAASRRTRDILWFDIGQFQ
jgi:hypothetical protein